MRTLFSGSGDLVLEPQVAAHAAEMFSVLSDPAIYEFEHSPPSSEAWLRERFAKLESRTSGDGTERWLNWVVRLPSGDLAGYVQATVTGTGVAHIAYVLASRFWGKGIGRAAVQAMLHELASQYGARDFVATLKAANYRSVALLAGLGFGETIPEHIDLGTPEADEIVMHKPARRSHAA
jgi:RimJ/RimL family protein N-acetyltransferase